MLITNTIVNLMAEKIHVRYLCLCISISLLDILKVRNVHSNRYQLFIVDRFYQFFKTYLNLYITEPQGPGILATPVPPSPPYSCSKIYCVSVIFYCHF